MNLFVAQEDEPQGPSGFALFCEKGQVQVQKLEGVRPPSRSEAFWSLWIPLGQWLEGGGDDEGELGPEENKGRD